MRRTPLQLALAHPLPFVHRVWRRFMANRGLVLAAAVAYYALLSIVPLLILVVIGLSHFVEREFLLQTLGHYLGWLVPGQSQALLGELSSFLEHRQVIGGMLLATLLFFSSLAFGVLNTALAAIFDQPGKPCHRHPLVAALLPYSCIFFLGGTVLLLTLVSSALQLLGAESLHLLGHSWSLGPAARVGLYLLGIGGEVLVLSAVYLIMPASRIPLLHGLIGGLVATLLWEVIRHALAWYYATLSQASLVYGSLSTAIVALLSLEIAATLLLLGAQVIAEYDRLGRRRA